MEPSSDFGGHNLTIPLTEARFEGAPLEIEIGPCRFELNPETGAVVDCLENHLEAVDGTFNGDHTKAPWGRL